MENRQISQQSGEMPVIDVPMNDEETNRTMPIDQLSPIQLNQVLMQDNINEKIIQQSSIQDQNSNSEFAPCEQFQPEFRSSSKQLEQQMVENVFSQIDVFQIGTMIPKQQEHEEPIFLPVFPYFYKLLDHGDRIVES